MMTVKRTENFPTQKSFPYDEWNFQYLQKTKWNWRRFKRLWISSDSSKLFSKHALHSENQQLRINSKKRKRIVCSEKQIPRSKKKICKPLGPFEESGAVLTDRRTAEREVWIFKDMALVHSQISWIVATKEIIFHL